MPNLGDVITTDDILVKGTGKYSAKYVNWARVAHLLTITLLAGSLKLCPLLMARTFGKLLTTLLMSLVVFAGLMVRSHLIFHRL